MSGDLEEVADALVDPGLKKRQQDCALSSTVAELAKAVADLGLKKRQDGAVSRGLKEVPEALTDLGLRRRNKTLLSLFHIRFGLGQRIPTFAIVS